MVSVGVVYDTNTIISAYGFNGKPEDAIKIGFYDEVEVYLSEETFSEFKRVLQYEHLEFNKKEQEEIPTEFCELTDANMYTPTEDLRIIEDDPDDDKFLELAIEADAEYIVSGDSHLTDLEEFEGINILPATEFIDTVSFDPPDSDLWSLI